MAGVGPMSVLGVDDKRVCHGLHIIGTDGWSLEPLFRVDSTKKLERSGKSEPPERRLVCLVFAGGAITGRNGNGLIS